jgi:intracellular septation protein
LKLLFDLFPVILFFVAFKFQGIYVATGVAIAATVAQVGWVLLKGRKVSNMQWTSLVYWLAGLVFIGGLAFRTNLVKAVMSEGITMPDEAWTKLCVAWGVFFLFKGTLNLWVAYNFDTDTWVNFKLFGGMGLMLAFVVAQAFWIAKYLPEEEAKPEAAAAPAVDTTKT